MRDPVRAILIGLLVGAALFFFPFGFPIVFFFLFIFILSRFFFGGRRWGYRRGWGYPYAGYYSDYNDITPIDGNRFHQRHTAAGSERKINIE